MGRGDTVITNPTGLNLLCYTRNSLYPTQLRRELAVVSLDNFQPHLHLIKINIFIGNFNESNHHNISKQLLL